MKFMLLVSALIGAVVLIWGVVISSVMRTAQESTIITKGVETARAVGLYARHLLEQRLADPNAPVQSYLTSLATATGGRPSGLLNVVVKGDQGTNAWMMRRKPFSYQALRQLPSPGDGIQVHRWMVSTDRGSRLAIKIEVPVLGASNQRLGGAWVLIDAQRVEDSIVGLQLRMAGAGVLSLLIGIVATYFLAGQVTRPVQVLMGDMEKVSRGDIDHQTKATSGDEIGRLAVQFNKMTRALREARDRQKETERLEHDLNAAREIQAQLLPPKIPQLPGFDVFPFYRSAKEVGGDYYDFFPLDRERLAMVVADVSGKGVTGAMVMAQTRTVMRMLAPDCGSAAETLRKTNYLIAREIKRGMFVTAMFSILHVHTLELVTCSAGHNPMVVFRERTGQCELVNPGGIALGFDKGPVFDRTLRDVAIRLEQGDRVVTYTDGVVEAMSERHEEYGDERFYKFVQEHARMRSKDFVMALVRDLDDHKGKAEQHDDITISTLRILG
jgi:serine phosphatase RsbU (regulator of sigma subunit)